MIRILFDIVVSFYFYLYFFLIVKKNWLMKNGRAEVAGYLYLKMLTMTILCNEEIFISKSWISMWCKLPLKKENE